MTPSRFKTLFQRSNFRKFAKLFPPFLICTVVMGAAFDLYFFRDYVHQMVSYYSPKGGYISTLILDDDNFFTLGTILYIKLITFC